MWDLNGSRQRKLENVQIRPEEVDQIATLRSGRNGFRGPYYRRHILNVDSLGHTRQRMV